MLKRKPNKYRLLLLFLTLFTLTACKVKVPKEVIQPPTMEQLLYDYHIAKAMGDGLPYTDNYKRALYVEDVFKKYNITEAQFDSSMVWYTRNTEVLSDMYQNINKRMKAELDDVKRLISIRDNKPITSEDGDSIDVWYMERVYRLTGYPLANRLTFNLPSDPNFHARDTLSWLVSYNYMGNDPDTARAALMAMHIVYENDSIISEIKKILHSGRDSIRLQSDTLGAIKEIKGFIFYNNPAQDSTGTLWIDSISLMRYHSQDSLSVNRNDSLSVNSSEPLAIEPQPITNEQLTPVQQR